MRKLLTAARETIKKRGVLFVMIATVITIYGVFAAWNIISSVIDYIFSEPVSALLLAFVIAITAAGYWRSEAKKYKRWYEGK